MLALGGQPPHGWPMAASCARLLSRIGGIGVSGGIGVRVDLIAKWTLTPIWLTGSKWTLTPILLTGSAFEPNRSSPIRRGQLIRRISQMAEAAAYPYRRRSCVSLKNSLRKPGQECCRLATLGFFPTLIPWIRPKNRHLLRVSA